MEKSSKNENESLKKFEQESSLISQILPKVLDRLDQVYLNTLHQNRPFLDIDQLAEYTGISKYTLYTLSSKGEIPRYHRGKKLYFSKEEIDNWILDRSNRHRSNAEIESEAATRVITGRGQ